MPYHCPVLPILSSRSFCTLLQFPFRQFKVAFIALSRRFHFWLLHSDLNMDIRCFICFLRLSEIQGLSLLFLLTFFAQDILFLLFLCPLDLPLLIHLWPHISSFLSFPLLHFCKLVALHCRRRMKGVSQFSLASSTVSCQLSLYCCCCCQSQTCQQMPSSTSVAVTVVLREEGKEGRGAFNLVQPVSDIFSFPTPF